MPVPVSGIHHVKTLLMSLHNRAVREYFKRVPHNDETPIEEWAKIDVPENSLKVACWILSNDSIILIILRLILFYVLIRPLSPEDLIGIYLSADRNEGVRRSAHPKVTLFFASRPTDDMDKIIWRQISFRIMDKSTTEFTKQEAIALAQHIKSKFGANYKWTTGKDMYSYTEWERGYQFQILGKKKEDIQLLIKDIMSLRSHVPNWGYLNMNSNESPEETYPRNTHQVTVLGDTFKEPVRRPITDIYFEFAMLYSPPHTPVCLFSRAGTQRDALIL